MLGALGGVMRADMADFMGHDSGNFRGVIGQRQQPARHIEIAARQGEGIDHRRIQQCHLVRLAGRITGGGKLDQRFVQQALGCRGVEFAAEQRHKPLVLAPASRINAGRARCGGRQRRLRLRGRRLE